ncbi:MAG: (Na+)-NQR maturation NqrM [Endozoicomonadaceae bacterium]|nr:(Na+)-NQR maturation NqrM [Endozoicomonadaceae bacterium]
MIIWLFTFCIFIFVVLCATLGLWLNKRTLSGSCGGLNQLGLKQDCPICGKQTKPNEDNIKKKYLFHEIKN